MTSSCDDEQISHSSDFSIADVDQVNGSKHYTITSNILMEINYLSSKTIRKIQGNILVF